MAAHFARRTLVHNTLQALRLPHKLIDFAATLPEKRRSRFLTARSLLAELMLRIYGIAELPELTISSYGRPHFVDRHLPDFSIAYAGTVVGVLLAEEGGRAGLGMEIVRAHSRQVMDRYLRDLSSGEKAWINAQLDPSEAAIQLWAMRKSLLKLTGRAPDPGDLLHLHPASGRFRANGFPDIQAVSNVEPLLLWSCAFSSGSERLHLWEYDEDENWVQLQNILVNKVNIGQHVLRLTSRSF
ncbi:4'-phosphopantetheinyl transferase family protein [Erwinia tasmaniensis]|uniref:4'-phosphopantetheinyl transferase family protein n=1 Tax=Erwinia tasmaniensis TaxID=338565 RepID=UPI003A4E0EAE